ncbi:MAG: pyridoxal-phosphate dependent enzyme [Fervidicoccaceae archaeon]
MTSGFALQCPVCGSAKEMELGRSLGIARCESCDSPLVPRLAGLGGAPDLSPREVARILCGGGEPISLGEGGTPLVPLRSDPTVLAKLEGSNPTGTFIDRGSAVLATVLRARGIERIVVASLGDLGVSASTYARRAGLSCTVYTTSITPYSKIYQAALLAERVFVASSYAEALQRARRAERPGCALVSADHHLLLAGYETILYEARRSFGSSFKTIVVPLGDGALLAALYAASLELREPATFVCARGSRESPLLRDVRVEEPLFGSLVEKIVNELGGLVVEVSEDEVLEAVSTAARSEGLLLDASGATVFAAMQRVPDLKRPALVVATGGPRSDPLALWLAAKLREQHGGLPVEFIESLGFTKMRILEVLATRGPAHPYAAWRALRSSCGLDVSLRTVYQHFEELQKMGLVECKYDESSARRRKLCEATRRGLEALLRSL